MANILKHITYNKSTTTKCNNIVQSYAKTIDRLCTVDLTLHYCTVASKSLF